MCLTRLEIKHDALRRIDPRCRVISALLLILAAVRLSDCVALALCIAVCALLLRRDIFRVLRRLLPLASFCALFLVQAAFNVIPLRSAFVFMLRMQCAALLCMALVAPSGMGNVAAALAAFRVSPKLISIIYLTYRYIFMMHDVVMCAVKAMRLRGGGGRGFAVWKYYAAVFAQALVTAIETAEDVSAALSTRGFDGVIPRTALWRWRVRDTMFAACAAVCAAAVFAAPSAKAFWGT